MTAPAINEAEARRLEALRLAMQEIVPFLDDPAVLEIALNEDGSLWVERFGEPMARSKARMSKDEVFRMLALIANTMNTEITAAKPSLAALIPGWQARLQAMVPPVVTAPVFTIRKPPRTVFTLDNYVERGIVSPRQAAVLREAVRTRANILIGGSTGSGKTTFANAVLHEISIATNDRLYIVEDMRELQSAALNKLQLFVQEPLYTWQRAIMDALRSRPDRIIVGELRTGAATLELVKAWNTGHPGGIATLHANDTGACLDRVCQLVEETVPTAPRSFIAQAINLVVHLTKDPRHPAGRRLTGVDRVRGLHSDGTWHLQSVS